MFVDLHIHTTASDGTWTPSELIAQAKLAHLGAIAITDHDSVDNVAEAQVLAQAAGLRYLCGTELNSTKAGLNFHVLGYGIDIHNKALKELMAYNIKLLADKDRDSIVFLERDGWPVSAKEFTHYDYDHRRGGWRALAYLIDKGLCTDVNDFFKRIFTPEHDLGFPEFPSIAQVIDVIHGAGGIAICAHAASGFHGPGLDHVLQLLQEEKFDGFECFHSCHTEEDTARLLEHCHKHGLYISGGSDCHGTFVPSRHLGEPKVHISQIRLPLLESSNY